MGKGVRKISNNEMEAMHKKRWPEPVVLDHAPRLAEAIRRVLAGEHLLGCRRRGSCHCDRDILEAAWRDYVADNPQSFC